MGKEKASAKDTKTSAKKTSSKKESKKEEFSVHNHVLLPKHEVLSEEDATALLEKLDVDANQLPNIYESDAGLNGLGAKPGHIIKITRKSLTAGTSVFYRRVIHE
jgi:DNA-directed RNA polymerase subunit H